MPGRFASWWVSRDRKLYLVYGLLALLLMLPLLGSGFILTLDMVFSPSLPMPDGMSSSYLLNAGLHYLNFILPGDIIQKIMLLLILVLSGVGAHRLVQSTRVQSPKSKVKSSGQTSKQPSTFNFQLSTPPTFFAGILYMINPFTYSRFMVGHYNVLLGYALMPFFVRYLLKFLEKPSLKASLQLTSLALIISIVSIHSIGLMLVVVLIAVGLTLWRIRKQKKQLLSLVKHGAVAAVSFLVASSYWLIPTLFGSSKTAQSIRNFDEIHRQAFATEGTGPLGAIGNVISLQGFWADAQSLYVLQKDVSRWWLPALLAILALVVTGILTSYRKQRFLIGFLVITILVAIILAVGDTPGLFARLNEWLIQNIPFFAGYREPQKFVGLLALAYAWLGAMGIEGVSHKVIKSKSYKVEKPSGQGSYFQLYNFGLFTIILLLPFLLTPAMLFGFNGQLKPRHYPPDWYALNQKLNSETGQYNVLFLPWHQYMTFGFSERIVANPADKFFDRSVITGDNPEFEGIGSSTLDPLKQYVEKEIVTPWQNNQPVGNQLAAAKIKYIILAKEADYQRYNYLEKQNDLHLVSETATIKLYRNEAFRE